MRVAEEQSRLRMADSGSFVNLREVSDLLHKNCIILKKMEKLATERDKVVKSLQRENQELREVLNRDLTSALITLQDISTSEARNLKSTEKIVEELEAVKTVTALEESLAITSEQNKALMRENALLRGELTAIQNERRSSK